MQVGNFIHYLSTFLAGLVVGFVAAWRLALLSVAIIPGIAFAGGLYAYTLTGLTSKSRESYANAGIIAEQVVHYLHFTYSQKHKNISRKRSEKNQWPRRQNFFLFLGGGC